MREGSVYGMKRWHLKELQVRNYKNGLEHRGQIRAVAEDTGIVEEDKGSSAGTVFCDAEGHLLHSASDLNVCLT